MNFFKKLVYSNLLKITLLNVLFFIISNVSFSQKFEGSIYFRKINYLDTAFFAYHVKENTVKIDELDKTLNVVNSLIVNLVDGKMTALSPSRKLYMRVHSKPYVSEDKSKYEIIKNDKNSKVINSVKCVQWRVKNKEDNTEISYWVSEGSYDFFPKLLKILNRSEKQAIYYLKIENSQNFFPMQSVERTLLRDEKMKLEVISIKKMKFESTFFIIPSDYNNFEN